MYMYTTPIFTTKKQILFTDQHILHNVKQFHRRRNGIDARSPCPPAPLDPQRVRKREKKKKKSLEQDEEASNQYTTFTRDHVL